MARSISSITTEELEELLNHHIRGEYLTEHAQSIDPDQRLAPQFDQLARTIAAETAQYLAAHLNVLDGTEAVTDVAPATITPMPSRIGISPR